MTDFEETPARVHNSDLAARPRASRMQVIAVCPNDQASGNRDRTAHTRLPRARATLYPPEVVLANSFQIDCTVGEAKAWT